MPNKSKPPRRKIKKATRHMAYLSGLPLNSWRQALKSKAALRNIDEMLKANAFYPVGIEGTSRDLPMTMTFEVQHEGPVENATKPVAYSGLMNLDDVPRMKPMTPEKFREMFASLKIILANAPTGIVGLDQPKQDLPDYDNDEFKTPKEEDLKELMKRTSEFAKKHQISTILTTPGRRDESISRFLTDWISAGVTHNPELLFNDRPLIVQQTKKRAEGPMAFGDPQYIYQIPISLKDLTDEQPGPTEPPPGIDPVPGDPEQGT